MGKNLKASTLRIELDQVTGAAEIKFVCPEGYARKYGHTLSSALAKLLPNPENGNPSETQIAAVAFIGHLTGEFTQTQEWLNEMTAKLMQGADEAPGVILQDHN